MVHWKEVCPRAVGSCLNQFCFYSFDCEVWFGFSTGDHTQDPSHISNLHSQPPDKVIFIFPGRPKPSS